MIMIESKLVDFILEYFDFESMKLSNSYYYDQLPFCIIDSVYSIGARYGSTKRTVATYAGLRGLDLYRPYGTSISSATDDFTVSDLLKDYEGRDYDNAAVELFSNKQRTSTRNGILKAEAVYRFARTLVDFSCEHFRDVDKIRSNESFKMKIKEIPGQKSGISLAYFFMLVGDESLVKPDRHILRFIESVTGRVVSQEEAQLLLSKVTSDLQKFHPDLTVRNLDHMIWRYSSGK